MHRDQHPDRQHPDHQHEPTLEEMRQALTREYWDERYAGDDRVWSGRPNLRLVEQAADLTAGRALDVGCGEGGDAIWLAEQGWDVTAVDVSRVALDRTAAHAIERSVDHRVRVGEYDVLAGTPPTPPASGGDGYDLVTAHFLHVPRPDFDEVHQRLARAVAPGGRLLVVAHHPDDLHSGARRSHGPDLMFGPDRVLGALGLVGGRTDEWDPEVVDAPVRQQQTSTGPLQVRDTVVRLRRR